MKRYAPRPIQFDGVHVHGDWRLKRYRIWHGGETFDARRFEAGVTLALAELPTPAVTAVRPGVGFLVAHQGCGADYLVLGWWDRENELPLRIFVREDNAWRPAAGPESVCVWDLQVVGHERDAYVEIVLGDAASRGGIDAYIARVLDVAAPDAAPYVQ